MANEIMGPVGREKGGSELQLAIAEALLRVQREAVEECFRTVARLPLTDRTTRAMRMLFEEKFEGVSLP